MSTAKNLALTLAAAASIAQGGLDAGATQQGVIDDAEFERMNARVATA